MPPEPGIIMLHKMTSEKGVSYFRTSPPDFGGILNQEPSYFIKASCNRAIPYFKISPPESGCILIREPPCCRKKPPGIGRLKESSLCVSDQGQTILFLSVSQQCQLLSPNL